MARIPYSIVDAQLLYWRRAAKFATTLYKGCKISNIKSPRGEKYAEYYEEVCHEYAQTKKGQVLPISPWTEGVSLAPKALLEQVVTMWSVEVIAEPYFSRTDLGS